jgi:hypothetical protein
MKRPFCAVQYYKQHVPSVEIPYRKRGSLEKIHVTYFFYKICRKKIQCLNNEKLSMLNRGYVGGAVD